MDKLKKNKILAFLILLSIIAFLFGIFFTTIISSNDIALVKQYINTFMNNIFDNRIFLIDSFKESLFINVIFIISIWLFGLLVISLPLIIFFYFFKVFSLGFSISSFVLTYKSKGLIFSIIYFFPNEILKYFAYTLLVFNSIKISKKIFKSIIKKENINFNKIIISYSKIFIIVFIIIIITSLYESFILPFLFSKLKFLIK